MLQAIRELLNKGEIMLTSNQIKRLQTTECWLREIRDSEEFRQLEYYPDVTLADAIQAVGELLDELNQSKKYFLKQCYDCIK